MNKRQKMKQKIVIKDSQDVKIIQAGRDVYYHGGKKPVTDEEGIKPPLPQEPELKTANILFMDIVGYSKLKSNQQAETIAKLNEIVTKCLPEERLLKLPTGDGTAVAFLENPESPLLTAKKIAPKAKEAKIPLRMGIHTGPVYLVEDINKQQNIVGGGINLCQRVMDCGDAGHILASKQIAESLSEVKEEYERLFHYLGKFEVKHGVEIEIYNVHSEEFGNSEPPKKTPESGKTLPLPLSLHNQTPPEPNFVGRRDELDTITQWYRDQNTHIGVLVGWGGFGKSALARRWFDLLKDNNIHPDGIFWWGFYRNAYLDRFLDELLRYVSERADLTTSWQKVEEIKRHITEREYLIILDGLEEMQEQAEGERFGYMKHPEFADLLKSILDTRFRGLCLITTRTPLTELKTYKEYKELEIERLSIEDGVELLTKVGVKGTEEEKKALVEEYDGHTLSLTLLAGHLAEDFKADIKKAKEIPPFYSDREAGGKAHRILLWYDGQLKEEQRLFMRIFSLFRGAVGEKEFETIFRPKIGMDAFHFNKMVSALYKRRLITEEKDAYTTHPLIKGYFEESFSEEEKKECHKRIYHYFGNIAPDKPQTLEEMQPLFEQVYHGCSAGLYDEVYWDVYWEKIYRREERFIIHKLGAWETNLSLAKNFFPKGDLSKMPKVSKKAVQSWLFNSAGLTLLSIGKPKNAEEPLLTAIKMVVEAEDWKNASMGYQNLAELQFRIGEIKKALKGAEEALKMAEKAKSDRNVIHSKAYLGQILYLLGETKEAERCFREADELEKKISGYRLCSGYGVFYADFLISEGKIDEADEITMQKMKICQENNWPEDISSCHRVLSAICRIKKRYQEAEEHLKTSLEIAKKVGVSDLEIEALIEYGRLYLEKNEPKLAIEKADQVINLCQRTGFKLYEPDAELILSRAYLKKDPAKAKAIANSALQKAKEMRYHSAKAEADHLLKNG